MTLYFLETGEGEDSTSTNITSRVTLGNKAYNINYRYNLRDESWTISLGLVGSDPLFTVKACCGRIFNSQYKHLGDAPKGDLAIIDVTGEYGRTDFEGFNIDGRYRLVYSDTEV